MERRQVSPAILGLLSTVHGPQSTALRQSPAVDRESTAGDVRGIVGGEEDHCLGDLFRLTQALHGHMLGEAIRQLLRRFGGGVVSAEDGRSNRAGGDGIPPLAQLKLLRALQEEVNERTEAFAKAHPDPSKLTPEQQTELDAVRSAQAELAALLEELAPPEPPAEPPAKEKP